MIHKLQLFYFYTGRITIRTMRHLNFRESNIRFAYPPRAKLTKGSIALLFIVTITSFLTACGSVTATAGQAKQAGQVSPTAAATLAPTPPAVPTHAPTPKPTPKPTVVPTPQPTLQQHHNPTQPPAPAPAILDLRPSSMSFVGHLDCSQQ